VGVVECVGDQWVTGCEEVDTSCTDWDCEDWEFKNEKITQIYDTKNVPWLVCTYKYDQLLKTRCDWSYFDRTTKKTVKGCAEYDEKKRAGVTYPYDKIKCDENECREVDEVTWFPPVFDSDSKDFFEYCVAHRSFFNVAQVTCWGKCLEKVGGPHYFGGSINPTREVTLSDGGKAIESEEQSPSGVRLPAKFGWEFDMQKSGMNEWEMAIDWARGKCKTELESGRECPYPSPPYQESEVREIIRRMLKENEADGERIFKAKYEIVVDKARGLSLPRGLGAGSFNFKAPVQKFLPLAEGQEIPDWQKPGNGTGDLHWGRKEMFEYFDYYFLSKTRYSGIDGVRFGFSGDFKEELPDGTLKIKRLFVYSPSQDSKEKFLWVTYQDPKENNLTKQIRAKKIGGTHGPCEITPYQPHNLFVYGCCASDPENCSPQRPDWSFYALGPEIRSILGIRFEEVKKVYPFHLQSISKAEGKIYRFIDIDWDRAWPSALMRRENLRKQSSNKVKYDYFYVGMVSFDWFDGGLNYCKRKCKKDCDMVCLDSSNPNSCENQCLRECKETYKTEEGIKACQDNCQTNFKKIREEKCPNCKGEEKSLGCIVCKDCSKEYSCSEQCVIDCYREEARRRGKIEEEVRDCDEVCSENPDLDLRAAWGECSKLTSEKERRICEICQHCQYKVDYVDVEWCSNVGESPLLSPFYKARIDTNFPPEVFYTKGEQKKCQDVKTPSLCKGNPCDCYKYRPAGTEILDHDDCQTTISDLFFPYPLLRDPEFKARSSPFKCHPQPSMAETDCWGISQFQIYDLFEGSKLVSTARATFEKLRVVRDVYKEFGDSGKKEVEVFSIPISLYDEKPWQRQPWWEWDKSSAFFSSVVPNSVIVGIEKKGSGLRWDFKINTLPKTQICNLEGKNCFGEEEGEYPFCWQILTTRLSEYIPPEKEFDKVKKEMGIYRTQTIALPSPDRILSFRLRIKSGGSFLEYLPKIPTQSPGQVKVGTVFRELEKKLHLEFPIWEIWNSLPPLENAKGRLNEEFSFEFLPCGDEVGFICFGNYLEQDVRITGEKINFPFEDEHSGPPPPKKIRIPHYFDWDPALGAASYWLKFKGAENFEKFIPDLNYSIRSREYFQLKNDGKYTWQIRTCADLCDKNEESFLQCGDYGKEMQFEGYNLSPPTKFGLDPIAQFLPEEINSITLSWDPIAEGTDCTHLVVKYLNPSAEEKREDCKKKAREGYALVDKIFEGKMNQYSIPPEAFPTSDQSLEITVDGRKISTKVCLGTYGYQVRYCTGESCAKKVEDCPKKESCPPPKVDPQGYLDCIDCLYSANCQEAGDWSSLRHFYIVTKKSPARRGGGGFGTCQNFIPCTDCKFEDIPKIISNILSCIVWTLSPIAWVFLLAYTGISIYFSFGSPEVIERAKSIWKAVGIGWLIMLFSWTIVNLIGKFFKMPGFK
jgi:hypothetical protein